MNKEQQAIHTKKDTSKPAQLKKHTERNMDKKCKKSFTMRLPLAITRPAL